MKSITSLGVFEFLQNIRGWVLGGITFLSAIIGFVNLYLEHSSIAIIVFTYLIFAGLFILLIYFLLAKTESPIIPGKMLYRYKEKRPFLIFSLIFIFAAAISLPISPTIGNYISTIFNTPTTTPAPIPTLTQTTTPPPEEYFSIVEIKTNKSSSETYKEAILVDNWKDGKLVIIAPSALSVGSDGFIELSIEPYSDGVTTAPDSSNIITGEIKLFPFIRAELTGTSFVIDEEGKKDKYVFDSGAKWRWIVEASKPDKDGKLLLHISTPIKVSGNGNPIIMHEFDPIPIDLPIYQEISGFPTQLSATATPARPSQVAEIPTSIPSTNTPIPLDWQPASASQSTPNSLPTNTPEGGSGLLSRLSIVCLSVLGILTWVYYGFLWILKRKIT